MVFDLVSEFTVGTAVVNQSKDSERVHYMLYHQY